MENPDNTLLQMSTSAGDVYLELFPEAAPLNVQRVTELVSASNAYYDNLTVHRSVRDTLIQTGDAERAGRARPARPVADEINARGLGLEQQSLLQSDGSPHAWLNVRDNTDFAEKVLIPLYRNMGIRTRQQAVNQQDTILQRLTQMNLMQIHELRGYRYNATLPSRRPVAGSVLMANYGPGTNDGELIITLTDTPWLTATHTVIGRVAGGLSVVARISREPEASVRVYSVRVFDNVPEISTVTRPDGVNINGQTFP